WGLRKAFCGGFGVPFVDLDADRLASEVAGGDEGGAGPGEWVGDDAGRARGDERLHEADRLRSGMVCPVRSPRGGTRDDRPACLVRGAARVRPAQKVDLFIGRPPWADPAEAGMDLVPDQAGLRPAGAGGAP